MTMIDGLGFPEALRWRHGALWFSDMFRGRVMRWVPGSPAEIVIDASGVGASGAGPTIPGGLGWLPDTPASPGALLVVDCEERRLLRVALNHAGQAFGSVIVHADLSDVMSHPANELHVDHDGTAWVGGYGFNPERDAPKPSPLVRIMPDGATWITPQNFIFPNGCERDVNGDLLVAETFADRITTYCVGKNVTLRARFPEGSGPDGLSVAPDGAVYVALAFAGALARLAPMSAGPDAEPTIIFRPEALPSGPGAGPLGVYDCAVHPDGSHIAVAMASLDEELAARVDTGRIVLLSLSERTHNDEDT